MNYSALSITTLLPGAAARSVSGDGVSRLKFDVDFPGEP
jgi:hypothetical protein